jgi:GNAT superfamily N-acetyltransferase
MDYEVRRVDITDRKILSEVNRLVTDVFKSPIADDRIALTTRTDSDHETLYLAAVKGGKIIGFNGFISHDLELRGKSISCYQSCWTATSADHRGKGIFPALVNHAKEFLAQQGAAMLFGFPNFNSQPILSRKLGFRETPSLKWQVPFIFGLQNLYLENGPKNGYTAEGVISQNDEQLIELKRRQYRDRLMVVMVDEGRIWGVPRHKRKLGLEIPYFEIGGVELGDRSAVKPLFQKFYAQLKNVRYVQLTTTVGNTLNARFKHLRPARTENLHVFDLNLDTTALQFNLFGGVKDVY